MGLVCCWYIFFPLMSSDRYSHVVPYMAASCLIQNQDICHPLAYAIHRTLKVDPVLSIKGEKVIVSRAVWQCSWTFVKLSFLHSLGKKSEILGLTLQHLLQPTSACSFSGSQKLFLCFSEQHLSLQLSPPPQYNFICEHILTTSVHPSFSLFITSLLVFLQS